MLGLGLGLHKQIGFRKAGSSVNPFADALAAYSLRSFGINPTKNKIEVFRVANNDVDQFTADQINNTTNVQSFGGASDLLVRTWFDESNNNNHAIQTDESKMPKIYNTNSSTLILSNNKPSISFVNGKYFTRWNNGSVLNNTTFSYIGQINQNEGILFSGFNQNYQVFTGFGQPNLQFNNGLTRITSQATILNQQLSLFGNINSNNISEIYYNNNSILSDTTGNLGFDGLTFGGNEINGLSGISQDVNEFIIWGTNKNRTDVISNQNSYYNTF